MTCSPPKHLVHAALLGSTLGLLSQACGMTDDVLGLNERASSGGASASGGTDSGRDAPGGAAGSGSVFERRYPNPFGELLGKTDEEVAEKLEGAFASLFHGDPTTESVFVEVGSDQAYLHDIRDDEVRDDGMGYAMLISLQLDKRVEFDRLWRWAATHMVSATGPLRGYMRHRCDVNGTCDETVGPIGHFYATTALLLADGRWGSSGTIDYRAAAEDLLAATFRPGSGLTTSQGELAGMIDDASDLPRRSPYASSGQTTAPGLMMPAFFAYWAEAFGASDAGADGFGAGGVEGQRAARLAAAARTHLQLSAHALTGLFPETTTLDGAPLDDRFRESCYGALLSVALDGIWFPRRDWHVAQADRLLEFFSGEVIGAYGTSYTIDGQLVARNTPQALWSANGALAAVASSELRRDFVRAVWDAPVPTGASRKFAGMFYLMGSLILGGQYRVY